MLYFENDLDSFHNFSGFRFAFYKVLRNVIFNFSDEELTLKTSSAK